MSEKIIVKSSKPMSIEQEQDFLGDENSYLFEGDLTASDGYHTFEELYDHRVMLYIALCKQIDNQPYCDDDNFGIWRSKKHSDGELAFGGNWFVLGIGKKKGKQITYHLPINRWDETNFAETLEQAPEYDGHTPSDVLERLKNLFK